MCHAGHHHRRSAIVRRRRRRQRHHCHRLRMFQSSLFAVLLGSNRKITKLLSITSRHWSTNCAHSLCANTTRAVCENTTHVCDACIRKMTITSSAIVTCHRHSVACWTLRFSCVTFPLTPHILCGPNGHNGLDRNLGTNQMALPAQVCVTVHTYR